MPRWYGAPLWRRSTARRNPPGRRRARYAGTSTSRCGADRHGLPAIDRALERLETGGALERLAREHGIPPRAPFETVSDASALAELRREHEVAKQ